MTSPEQDVSTLFCCAAHLYWCQCFNPMAQQNVFLFVCFSASTHHRWFPVVSHLQPASLQSQAAGLVWTWSIHSSSDSSWQPQWQIVLNIVSSCLFSWANSSTLVWRRCRINIHKRFNSKKPLYSFLITSMCYQMESLVRLRSILPSSCRMMSVFRFPSLSWAE